MAKDILLFFSVSKHKIRVLPFEIGFSWKCLGNTVQMQSQSEIGATNGSPGSHKVTPALIFTANVKEYIEIRTLLGPNKNKQLWARQ